MSGFRMFEGRRARTDRAPAGNGMLALPRALTPARANMLAAALEETEATVLLVAAGASIAQAQAQGRPLQPWLEAAHYLPERPLLFPCLLAELCAVDGRGTLVASLQQLHLGIDILRAHARSLGAPALSGVPLQSLNADGWARLIGRAAVALYEWDHLAITFDDGRVRRVNPQVMALTLETRAGAMACIGEDGDVIIPGWFERRTQRQPVQGDVRVHVDGKVTIARLRDVSRSGFGLEGCAGLQPGMRFRLELGDGRAFVCETVWVEGGRAGARILEAACGAGAAAAAV